MLTLKKVAVIGSGTMGSGIAQWFCQQNIAVFLIDKNLATVESAKKRIHSSWDELLKKGKFQEQNIILFKNILDGGLLDQIPQVDLVIEAIFEDLNLKQQLFSSLDKLVAKDCILASNTSSFLMKDIQEKLPAYRHPYFVGLHFFNPPVLMKLVEIIKAPKTAEELVEELKTFFNNKEKIPIVCIDSPGFVVNRLARHFYGESLRISEELEATEDSFKYIDQTLMTCGGFKMGPFALMDLIGIDINLDVTTSVWNAFNQAERFKPHLLQEEKVRNKHFGKKSKKGFYLYE